MPGLKLITKEDEKLNLNVYHIKYFQSLIHENVVWAVMCLFLPEQHVWMPPSETIAYLPHSFHTVHAL
jgi:hypothetical protein